MTALEPLGASEGVASGDWSEQLCGKLWPSVEGGRQAVDDLAGRPLGKSMLQTPSLPVLLSPVANLSCQRSRKPTDTVHTGYAQNKVGEKGEWISGSK